MTEQQVPPSKERFRVFASEISERVKTAPAAIGERMLSGYIKGVTTIYESRIRIENVHHKKEESQKRWDYVHAVYADYHDKFGDTLPIDVLEVFLGHDMLPYVDRFGNTYPSRYDNRLKSGEVDEMIGKSPFKAKTELEREAYKTTSSLEDNSSS
jgi:hypothetical protein